MRIAGREREKSRKCNVRNRKKEKKEMDNIRPDDGQREERGKETKEREKGKKETRVDGI